MSLPNIWHLRRVADSASKACYICYKPTSSVLITPDSKDFFYICAGHLKDRGFCTPVIDEAEAAAKKKKEELDKEIETVKKEYEEKMKKRKEKKKDKDKDKKEEKEDEKKGSDKVKKDAKEKAEEDKDEKERDEKACNINALTKEEPKTEEGPRIFTLQKNFYQMRVDRIKNAELAKRNRERYKNPTLFPSVPSGDL